MLTRLRAFRAAERLLSEVVPRSRHQRAPYAQHDAQRVRRGSGGAAPGADPAAVAIVYVVSAFPSAERALCGQTSDRVLQNHPHVKLVSVFLPEVSNQRELSSHTGDATTR